MLILQNVFTVPAARASSGSDAERSYSLRRWLYIGMYLLQLAHVLTIQTIHVAVRGQKSCDVVCRTCTTDLDVQLSVDDVIPCVCASNGGATIRISPSTIDSRTSSLLKFILEMLLARLTWAVTA